MLAAAQRFTLSSPPEVSLSVRGWFMLQIKKVCRGFDYVVCIVVLSFQTVSTRTAGTVAELEKLTKEAFASF